MWRTVVGGGSDQAGERPSGGGGGGGSGIPKNSVTLPMLIHRGVTLGRGGGGGGGIPEKRVGEVGKRPLGKLKFPSFLSGENGFFFGKGKVLGWREP